MACGVIWLAWAAGRLAMRQADVPGDVSAALEELETGVKRFAAYFALPVSAC